MSRSRMTTTTRKTFFFITLSFIAFFLLLSGEDFTCLLRPPPTSPPETAEKDEVAPPFSAAKGWRREEECDVFDGEWVYDEAARPLYAEQECPYIQPQLTCMAHGRPDSGYQHWRWQPRHCSLPSFNGTIMLEMLRGKRMMFVGDSLNRGQFVSLVCLLHRASPDLNSMDSFHSDSLTVFTVKSYNATVEFYWAPFLVESNSDDAVVHRVTDRVIRVGSINKHARHWRGADILVFNTYLWWMADINIKTTRGDGTKMREMRREEAYRVALGRTVRWVEKNMDPNKTRLFFVSISPSHHRSEEWGGEMGGNCYNETSPIEDPTYWSPGTSKTMMSVASQVMGDGRGGNGGGGFPVTFLNITQLSEYRKDAHTQIYKKQWNPLTAAQLAEPRGYADCIHWCLPGLQDTWNELLYTKLLFPSLMAT